MSEPEPGCNLRRPILDVRYADLGRLPGHRRWARSCPACEDGILAVMRDRETFALVGYDCCLLCGQRVCYTDFDDMLALDAQGRRP